jgi:hypothetical protein
MPKKSHLFAVVVGAAGICAAAVTAPVAAAAPECTQTAPRTTLCETSGSAQLTTSPPLVQSNPYPYFGFGFGRGGIFIG